jgi:hypothetical protein
MQSRTLHSVLWLLLYLSLAKDSLTTAQTAPDATAEPNIGRCACHRFGYRPSTSTSARKESVKNMKVEIDIYSGRPNPSWDLTAPEVSELQVRLKALPAIATAIRPESLGYRGLRAAARSDAASPSSEQIVSIELGNGVVNLLRRNGLVEHFVDTDRSVECWLLSTARGRVDEAIRHSAVTELSKSCP